MAKKIDRQLSPRYYTANAMRKQLPYLITISLMFFGTVLYASEFKNPTVRMTMYYLSLVYPCVILLSLLASIPKFNYTQLSSQGVHTTILGVIHRTVYWKDLQRIGKTYIGNLKGLGLQYKPGHRTSWAAHSRKMMFGWDEAVPDAYSTTGKSLISETTKMFKKYSTPTPKKQIPTRNKEWSPIV